MASGLSVVVIVVIWLGMSRIFEKGHRYAVYFNESVQGLAVDSPVKYRGVAIGRVERIRVAADSKLIEVVLKVESDLRDEEEMVAQLKVVGITGSMFIELDRNPQNQQVNSPQLNFPTEYPVLASRPSDVSELFRGIDAMVQKLNHLDIEGISNRLKTTLDHVDQAVVATDVAAISKRVHLSLDKLDRSVADLDTQGISKEIKTSLASLNTDLEPERWGRIMNGLEKTTNSLEQAVGRADRLMADSTNVMSQAGDGINLLNNHLAIVGQDMELIGEQMRRFLEQLNDQPSQLLFSAPPPRRPPD